MSLYAIIALLLFLLVPAFSGGRGTRSSKPPSESSSQPKGKPSDLKLPSVPPQNPIEKTPEGMVENQPTPVPTPALLPGLIGLGVQVARKRKSEANEETTDNK